MRDPEEEIRILTERLERAAVTRRNYQDQQARGLMTLDELGERLSELDETARPYGESWTRPGIAASVSNSSRRSGCSSSGFIRGSLTTM